MWIIQEHYAVNHFNMSLYSDKSISSAASIFALYTGGAFPFTIGRIEHGFNVRPDLCAVENPFNPRSVCPVQYMHVYPHSFFLMFRLD